MAFSATRSIHHPLAALEAQVVDLQQRLAIKEAEIVAEQNRRSSERKAYERLRNENMRLSAAISEAEGAVSKIGSESMWKKEAAVLALKLKRWHVEDRAELCYRALFRTWNDAGDKRVVMDMVELQGGLFERMRAEIRHERDLEVAADVRSKQN